MWKSSVRVYFTVCFISTFVLGPTDIASFFPNTSERVVRSFIEQSLFSSQETNKSLNIRSQKKEEFGMSFIWGFYGAEIYIGSLCGSIFCLFMGRRLSAMSYIKLISVLTVPSFALQFLSRPTNSWECLLIGRFSSQIGQGIGHIIIPVFVSEIANPSQRGQAAIVFRLCGVVLAALASLLGHHSLLGTEEMWHWHFVLVIIMALLGIVGFLVIPNSPEYFLASGDVENAKKSLEFYGDTGEVHDDLSEIRKSMEVTSKLSLWQLSPVIFLAAVVTLTADRAIHVELLLYTTVVFELLGFSPGDAQTISVVSKSCVLGVALLSPYMVSKIGRRRFFLFVGVFTAAGYTLLASFPFWPMIAGLEWLFVLTTASLVLAGFLALSLYYVIIAEIFPFQHRMIAKSTSLVFYDAACALSTFAMYPAFEKIGLATFWFSAVPLWMCVGFLAVKMPETKDKTTEEILKDVGVDMDVHP